MTRLDTHLVMGDAPLIIDVIDNGGQWTHREWRMLRYLGVDTKIFPNDTPLNELREVDGLILSGGAARVGLTGELGHCADYLSLQNDSGDRLGVQFHPEVNDSEFGETIFRNFVNICDRARKTD